MFTDQGIQFVYKSTVTPIFFNNPKDRLNNFGKSGIYKIKFKEKYVDKAENPLRYATKNISPLSDMEEVKNIV